MWVVTHVLTGSALAAALAAAPGGAWPWWAVLTAVLLLHLLLDLVPHWDYTETTRTALFGSLDFVASLAAFLAVWRLLGYPFASAFLGLASGAPDWDVLVALLRGPRARKLFPSHWDRFPHGRAGRPWGIGVQAALMAASVAVVLALRP